MAAGGYHMVRKCYKTAFSGFNVPPLEQRWEAATNLPAPLLQVPAGAAKIQLEVLLPLEEAVEPQAALKLLAHLRSGLSGQRRCPQERQPREPRTRGRREQQ